MERARELSLLNIKNKVKVQYLHHSMTVSCRVSYSCIKYVHICGVVAVVTLPPPVYRIGGSVASYAPSHRNLLHLAPLHLGMTCEAAQPAAFDIVGRGDEDAPRRTP